MPYEPSVVADARTTTVVIPALNEEAAVGRVVRAITDPRVGAVIVADNGSTDRTADVARAAGAMVIAVSERGYGAAVAAGIAAALAAPVSPFAIATVDADLADDPAELPLLLDPLYAGAADLVIGSRVARAAPGALTPQARFGNALATALIRLRFGHAYTDLGPFRALTAAALARLGLTDRGYGWTVEMQVKAVRRGLRVREVDVSYRPRIGRSKISGTVRGVLGAGSTILWTIAREAIARDAAARDANAPRDAAARDANARSARP
jgi:glycosyltransferase involved in cell wall biosynthesis